MSNSHTKRSAIYKNKNKKINNTQVTVFKTKHIRTKVMIIFNLILILTIIIQIIRLNSEMENTKHSLKNLLSSLSNK